MKVQNETKIQQMLEIVSGMPKEYFFLLKTLCDFLIIVHENRQHNRMNIENLAIIFGPILFTTKDDNNAEKMLHNIRITTEMVKILIMNHDKFVLKEPKRFSISTIGHNSQYSFVE